jgi:hypothetical protein
MAFLVLKKLKIHNIRSENIFTRNMDIGIERSVFYADFEKLNLLFEISVKNGPCDKMRLTTGS